MIDDFLPAPMVNGKTALDVGCGLGYFSERLVQRGATVLACNVGPGLLERTRTRVGCQTEVADAMRLTEQFGRDRFDLVVSSECIAHTPWLWPAHAIHHQAFGTYYLPGACTVPLGVTDHVGSSIARQLLYQFVCWFRYFRNPTPSSDDQAIQA